MEKWTTFTVVVCILTTYTLVTLPDTIQTISHEGTGAFSCSQSLLMTRYPEPDGNLEIFCYFTIVPDCQRYHCCVKWEWQSSKPARLVSRGTRLALLLQKGWSQR